MLRNVECRWVMVALVLFVMLHIGAVGLGDVGDAGRGDVGDAGRGAIGHAERRG